MPKRSVNLAIIIFLLLAIGCSKNVIMNTDGMPVATHEYNLTSNETKIRAVFVLARYFKEYEGKEYLVKPEYLDAFINNWIMPEDTEQLILHVKVVNLDRKQYSFDWAVDGPESLQAAGHVYTGKLSRKDFYIRLPYKDAGDYEYSFKLRNEEGVDLFDLPAMRYKVKGGERYSGG